MLDIKFIRNNPDLLDKALARRGMDAVSAEVIEKDKVRRHIQTEIQDLQQKRNQAAKEIGMAKGKGEEPSAELMKSQIDLRDHMQKLEEQERSLSEEFELMMMGIPNILADEVPNGLTEDHNKVIRTVGEKPGFSFKPQEHFDLGEKLGMMDFERAAKISGSRFVVLSGDLAKLERALAAFMIDIHTSEFGYREVMPPYLVRDSAFYGTGQLPKFGEDAFKTTNDYWLIPTGEVPLTNLVAGEMLDITELPVRYTAYTPCFRSEAGSAGKDTRGMIRQHQFTKVELVSIVHPDKSEEEHERMTGAAETILKRLGLSYQVILKCAGDTGAHAHKTYDLEVWLPGQNQYREISSCSTCWDYQARRMKARFKAGKEKNFVHTLNGSGLAIGRTMVAILENYQQEDGKIRVPEALVSYMGKDIIG